MNNMRMLAEEEENDDGTEVTWEDQQRINTFSKLNTRLRSIEERLEELKSHDSLQQEKEALDDLSTELELTDEDESVLYKIGESFLHLPQPRAIKRLEKDQAALSVQILDLSAGAEQCEKEMKELKVTLYARFGRAINLDE
ncbi:Prefoldin subunit 4 [Suillus hirtellus]|nr:Prefoldin subunit 4 [Suillus hirtellus]